MTTSEFKQLYDETVNNQIKFLFNNKDFKFSFGLTNNCYAEQKENLSFDIIKSVTIESDDNRVYKCSSIKNLSLIETIKFLNKESDLVEF